MAITLDFNQGVERTVQTGSALKNPGVIVLYAGGANQGKTHFTQAVLDGLFRAHNRYFVGFHCGPHLEKKDIPGLLTHQVTGYIPIPIEYQPDDIAKEMMTQSCRKYFRKPSDFNVYIFNPNHIDPPKGIEDRVDLIIRNPDSKIK